MEAGKFYSSTGVSLASVEVEGRELKVRVATENEVNYTIEFIGVLKNESEPKILKTVNGGEGSFTLTDEYLFVRSKIISSKIKSNPFQEGDYEMAWTQPVMFSK